MSKNDEKELEKAIKIMEDLMKNQKDGKVDVGIEPRRSARDGLEEIKRKLVNNTQVTQTIINSEQAKTIANLPVTEAKETESSKLFKMKKKDSQKRVEEQIKKWEMKND